MMPSIEELRRDFCLFGATAPIIRADACLPDGFDVREAAVAIGAFDGFHIGHQELVRRMVADARRRGVAAVVVTFDPDPDCVVGPGPAPKLMDAVDRLSALASSGVDAVLVIPFTRELAALDHVGFFEDVLASWVSVRAVHVGSDFRLGRGGAATVDVMRAWGVPRGIDVFGYDLVDIDGAPVSASRIRSMLEAGDVRDAARALGRRYAVRGRIASGRGQGTQMGFPTANIEVPAGALVPKDGVYAGLALIDGVAWPAAVNAGLPPTYAAEQGSAHLEANLIGFRGDVRGHAISLAFDRFLRPSRVFASTDELVSTVLANIATIRDEFGERGVDIGDLR